VIVRTDHLTAAASTPLGETPWAKWMAELITKPFGWVVEVSRPAPDVALKFNVAEPNKAQAIAAVRRRIPQAATAEVEATTALSSHTVYGVLRMKRGDVAQIG